MNVKNKNPKKNTSLITKNIHLDENLKLPGLMMALDL